MLTRNTIQTIITKFFILLANFGLVVFTTQVWGSEGRGEIALVIANISIITIFSNVFCGSAMAYHSPILQREFLLFSSFVAAIIISLCGAVVFSIFFGFGGFTPLFLISLLISLTTAISSYWLGKNNIRNYNQITLIIPVLILVSLAVLYFIFKRTSLNTVYLSYYSGTGTALIIGIAGLAARESFKVPEIRPGGIKSIARYGINNEFNYLLQFINYRLSYYFIAKMLGMSDLGIFSVVVAVSEAVWIISRSMSAVHFSNVINAEDPIKSRDETISFAKQSLIISLILLVIAVLIPGSVYQLIFGNEFASIGKFILYLIPGITAIAVSNLFGHYFAGTGKLFILRNKSLLGLTTTLILLPVLIRKYQLTGACISLNISYILSSIYLWIYFRKTGKSEK